MQLLHKNQENFCLSTVFQMENFSKNRPSWPTFGFPNSTQPKPLLWFLEVRFSKNRFSKKMGSEKIFWNRLKGPFLGPLFPAFGPKKSTFPKNFFFRKKCDFGLFEKLVFGRFRAHTGFIWALIGRIWEPWVCLRSLGADAGRFRKI